MSVERSERLLDQFLGCMVGLAVGDALGAASEFMKEHQVREAFGVLRDYHGAGQFGVGEFTDDTSMALAIAESTVHLDSVDTDEIADSFLQWMHNDGRGIGILTMHSLRLIEEGLEPLDAGKKAWEMSGMQSAGNGAVMRCAPIGLYNWSDAECLVEDSIRVSRITHYDPRCCWSCVALNSAIASMLIASGNPMEVALDSVRGQCPELEDALAESTYLDVESMRLDGDDMGYTILTTQAAFTALRQFGSFEDGIVALVNKGGDADTNACVAGALLGTKFGLSGIPERWVEDLIGRERVMAAGEGLFDLAVP